MNPITDPAKIEQLLSRAVDTVYPSKDSLQALLASGKRIRLYTGVDPTSPDLHIGHTLWMWKLREFQDLGHEVILLMGSFTAMIGDPTDKLAARKPLTREEVLANTKNYKKAASKILRFSGENPAKIMWNHKWLEKLTMKEVIELSAQFTVQQMLERDMFEKRMAEQKPIGLHEFLYPLMQGYDSVAMDVDLEIGATDQIFNMLAGRTLQRSMKNREKLVLATPLLVDANGKKIGKSEGNVIGILDAPEDLFGKIMTLGDDAIFNVFEFATRVPMEKIAALKAEVAGGGNPRDAKMELASAIVELYHSKAAAKRAKKHFETVFQKHEMPAEMTEFKLAQPMGILDLLVATKLAESKSDARRLVEQGGVQYAGEVVKAVDQQIAAKPEGAVLQKGKRFFVRIVS